MQYSSQPVQMDHHGVVRWSNTLIGNEFFTEQYELFIWWNKVYHTDGDFSFQTAPLVRCNGLHLSGIF